MIDLCMKRYLLTNKVKRVGERNPQEESEWNPNRFYAFILKFNLTIIILKLPLQPNPGQFSVIPPFEKQAS